MANQLDLGLIEQATPAEPMEEYQARRVLEYYQTLSTRKIARHHRIAMSTFSGSNPDFASHVRVVNEARDVLMAAACRPH
jgi:hypothetical protein